MVDPNSALWGKPPANANDRLILTGMSGKFAIPHKGSDGPGSNMSQSVGPVVGMSIALSLVVLLTSARLAARTFYTGQRFGLDDAVIIPAALIIVAWFAVNLSSFSYAGAGKHTKDVTYAQIQLFHVFGETSQTLFFGGITLVKISMLLFIRRVTGVTSRAWRIFNNIFLAILVAWFAISVLTSIFPCSPVLTRYTYSSRALHPDYRCLDQAKITVTFCIIHATTDFILFCVPIYIILKVRMSLGRKIRLAAVYTLGAVCVIASIMRATLAGGAASLDFTWQAIQAVCWTLIDITFSAIVVNLPALNAIFEDFFTKVGRSRWWTTLTSSETITNNKSSSYGSSNAQTISGGSRSRSSNYMLSSIKSPGNNNRERAEEYDELV